MQYFAVEVVHLLLSLCFLYLSSTSSAQVYTDVNCINTASNYTAPPEESSSPSLPFPQHATTNYAGNISRRFLNVKLPFISKV
jgi:hypothetical protein